MWFVLPVPTIQHTDFSHITVSIGNHHYDYTGSYWLSDFGFFYFLAQKFTGMALALQEVLQRLVKLFPPFFCHIIFLVIVFFPTISS